MVDILVGSPLLTLFLVIALGAAFGAIRFGPVAFGPAGALFVGLAIGALDPRLGEGLALLQGVGLALFVYTIGLAAGASFFADLRKQFPLMMIATTLLAVLAAGLIGVRHLVGWDAALTGGVFSGSMTSTPALAAATDAAGGGTEAAVGYAIAYPIAVITGVLLITLFARFPTPARKDPESISAAGLRDISAIVDREIPLADIPRIAREPIGGPTPHSARSTEGQVRVSYLERDGRITVAAADETLRRGDRVVLVGIPDAVEEAAEFLGGRATAHLAEDRTQVDHRRFLVSDPAVAGRSVAELDLHRAHGAVVTRILRNDRDLLAQPHSTLQLGDRLRIVYPKDQREALRGRLGDSDTDVTRVDFLPVGLGLAVGVAIGLVSLSIGGVGLALGNAAGPLLVGLILGRVERTGPLVWRMPIPANLILRQFGLIVFLACVGLGSGAAFAGTAFSWTGVQVVVTTVVVLAVMTPLLWVLARALGLSMPRILGAIAGFIGQPVLIAHANTLVRDERAENGYSAVYAWVLIIKILLAQAIVLV
ncbi:MAG: TrkA C-terminal domain-containing protein [Brachybacterium sp.]|nr:TrkA C-terminal domain-containing protein [Brachybacterium sp.]